MVTTFYPPHNFGGDGIFIRRLANELAERGHFVDVIHDTDSYRLLAGAEPTPDPPGHPNITVHQLRSPFGALSPIATQQTGYPFFKAAAIKRIFAKGFDVIHFHNTSLVGGPGVLKLGQAPVKLYTMHEFWLICATHVLYKFNREVCTSRECIKCQLSYRRPPQLWRHTDLMRNALKHVDLFISPDRHTIGKHHEIFPEMPIVHVPHFVPAVPLAATSDSAPPYFLFVGRLEKLKGLQDILPLFRTYPHAQLWIAGTGDYGSELRAIAQDSPNIKFLGYQTGTRFQELYRQALAVITPSANFEVAPPLCIMEGFRQQTPSLVLNIGSMPEIIADSDAGFAYNDVRDLEEKMTRIAKDRAFRDELGMRGYRAYQERWTTDAHFATYFGLIREVAAKKGVSLD